eukprot:TRINITY_DN1869_c0_g1_i3.p1 TRINITY_DN1869_c0_g1~~TRINITY_DN1869_c0_g1_i3.p1  ORF type:complete len:198 (-),score=20.88 TRINITY_DN1869_c0_g1_i3:1420-2013(-)
MTVHQIAIPIVCFAFIVAYHGYEFVRVGETRKLFAQVRKGWVDNCVLTGQQAVNTTRDYIRVASALGGSSIIIAIFVAGVASGHFADCANSGTGCTQAEVLVLVKLGTLVGLMCTIFFLFTQCARFAIHFSFMINTREMNSVPLPPSLMTRVFDHAHWYYSVGIRAFFVTIPVVSWLFTSWCLLGVTPVYLLVVHGE